MKIQTKKLFQVSLLFVIAFMISCGSVLADDLNPPPYRGQPLSVFVHWSGSTGLPQIPDWDWVDDSDPSTYLYPSLFPSFSIIEEPTGSGSIYQFTIPNIVDELPLKLLRIQLTWVGTTAPPLGINGIGSESGATVPGTVTYASRPNVYTQPDGGYQYFDLEFRPNPDFEVIDVNLPQNAELVQVVIDSVSIVPEPMTMGLLALGGLGLIRRKKVA